MQRVSHKADVLVFRGKRFAVLKRIIDVNGNEIIRDVVSFGVAVAVLPIINDSKVVLVKQYRAPVNSWILEVPAGKVELGESPEECARRELEEETGYRAMRIEKLVSIYTSPGYSDEVLHIYLAKELVYVGAKPERYELLKVVVLPIDEAIKSILSAPIVDAKTLLALLFYTSLYRSSVK